MVHVLQLHQLIIWSYVGYTFRFAVIFKLVEWTTTILHLVLTQLLKALTQSPPILWPMFSRDHEGLSCSDLSAESPTPGNFAWCVCVRELICRTSYIQGLLFECMFYRVYSLQSLFHTQCMVYRVLFHTELRHTHTTLNLEHCTQWFKLS